MTMRKLSQIDCLLAQYIYIYFFENLKQTARNVFESIFYSDKTDGLTFSTRRKCDEFGHLLEK